MRFADCYQSGRSRSRLRLLENTLLDSRHVQSTAGLPSAGPGRGTTFLRQRSEQYRTCSQQRAHFFRQLNGRPQAAHTFVGNGCFPISQSSASSARNGKVRCPSWTDRRRPRRGLPVSANSRRTGSCCIAPRRSRRLPCRSATPRASARAAESCRNAVNRALAARRAAIWSTIGSG